MLAPALNTSKPTMRLQELKRLSSAVYQVTVARDVADKGWTLLAWLPGQEEPISPTLYADRSARTWQRLDLLVKVIQQLFPHLEVITVMMPSPAAAKPAAPRKRATNKRRNV
jgi:hypothetical protein